MDSTRIRSLEEDLRPESERQGGDIVITVVTESTSVGPDSEKRRFHQTPIGYDEGEWRAAGNGDRINRYARYAPDASRGILRNP